MSLTLYAFSPTMLANGFLATSDTCVALFLAAATWGQWKLLQRVSATNVAPTCLAAAGAMLSKLSGVIVVPVFVALAAVR